MTEADKMAKIVYEALDDKKGIAIKIINISKVSILADYFIVANGSSQPQIQAMERQVQEKMHEAGYHIHRLEGNRGSSWLLMDYGDVVVHIFNPQDRLFYDLEHTWSDGEIVSPEDL